MTSVDDRDVDSTFENEQSTVTIPLREYEKLKERQKYINLVNRRKKNEPNRNS